MKQNWKVIGIAAIATGILIYPAIKLYQYITNKGKGKNEDNPNEDHHMKAFVPAYRGHYKPHHRHNNPRN